MLIIIFGYYFVTVSVRQEVLELLDEAHKWAETLEDYRLLAECSYLLARVSNELDQVRLTSNFLVI